MSLLNLRTRISKRKPFENKYMRQGVYMLIKHGLVPPKSLEQPEVDECKNSQNCKSSKDKCPSPTRGSGYVIQYTLV